MSFGKFGARPRSMRNPVYWVSSHLQTERRRHASERAVDRFNKRWHRLNDIYQNLAEHFVVPLSGHPMSKRECDLLQTCVDAATERKKFIADNLNECSLGELSKYATALKRLTLVSFGLCKKLGIYGDIETMHYDATSKSMMLNSGRIYFLG